MRLTWTQEQIDAEVATYGDDWEYRPMRVEALLSDMIANPGNAAWVGMKMMDEYCGRPTNYAATTIFRAMVEAYAAERGIALSEPSSQGATRHNDVNDDCAQGRISRPDVIGGV